VRPTLNKKRAARARSLQKRTDLFVFFSLDHCGDVLPPVGGGGGLPAPEPLGEVVPGLFGVDVPGAFVPGEVLFGTPPGVVDPGAFGFCGVVSGAPAGGVAVPAGGVAVPAGGVAVPAGGVAAPGVELCPAVPEPPAGAVPPEGELCATTQLA